MPKRKGLKGKIIFKKLKKMLLIIKHNHSNKPKNNINKSKKKNF